MKKCPIHSGGNRIKLDLKKSALYKQYGEVNAIQCLKCKKVYIDLKGIKTGVIGRTKSGYKIENVHKHYSLPKELYVLDKQDYKIISKHVNKATGFYVDNNWTNTL